MAESNSAGQGPVGSVVAALRALGRRAMLGLAGAVLSLPGSALGLAGPALGLPGSALGLTGPVAGLAATAPAWLLASLAMGCRRAEAPPAPRAGADPRDLRHLLRGPTSPGAAVDLAKAATALQAALPQPASASAALAAEASPAAWQPGDEGTLLGLDDAEWVLARLRRGLAAEFAGLDRPGALQLQRQAADARLHETLRASAARLQLQSRGLDWQVWRDAAGCAAALQPPGEATRTTLCPEPADQALALAGAVAALARADLAPLLRVEALHFAGGTALRLAVPAWRLRFRVQLDAQGQLQRLEVPGLAATLRPQRIDGQGALAVFLRGDQLAWRWRVAAEGAGDGGGGPAHLDAAVPWQLQAPPPGVAMSDGAALEALLQRFDASLQAARATLLGPISVEVHAQAGQWRAVAVHAAVLVAAGQRAGQPPEAGRQPAELIAAPLLGGEDPGQWLQSRSEDCLFLSQLRQVSLRGPPQLQLSARACAPLGRPDGAANRKGSP